MEITDPVRLTQVAHSVRVALWQVAHGTHTLRGTPVLTDRQRHHIPYLPDSSQPDTVQ